jgi:hypothetical protein
MLGQIQYSCRVAMPTLLCCLAFLASCSTKITDRTAIQTTKAHMSELKWGQQTAWCQISVSMDKTEFKASENIYLTVVVKNASEKPVPYQPFPFAPGIDYEVKNADGSPASLTAYGTDSKESAGVSSSAIEELESGKEWVYEVLLNRRYDLTRAGQYRCEAFRQLGTDSSKRPVRATSNVVAFKVLEDE